MAQITIDTNDDKVVLIAVRNMLSELVGELSGNPSKVATAAAQVTAENDDSVFDTATVKTAPAGMHVDSGAADTTTSASTPTAAAGNTQDTTDNGVDHNDVEFNGEMCSKAKEPFYGSGKKKGQWKKRQGVDEATYDAWYAEELEAAAAIDAIAGTSTTTTAEETVDTSAAFGAGETTGQPAADAPKDAGAFMGWVAEQQAAENITEAQIGQAYAELGLTVVDLFPPNTPETVAQTVAKLYALLTAKA